MGDRPSKLNSDGTLVNREHGAPVLEDPTPLTEAEAAAAEAAAAEVIGDVDGEAEDV